jgi:ATP phosphoribosyltransferase regulatory subunit
MAIWALPENIEDLLPLNAAKLERMRRTALDTFSAHGYELVMPPLLEYVESLLSGVGEDMNLATFKLVDQLSGRMMGIRADTTPQVARIDAHVLNRAGVVRLCYAGSVLHTRPSGLGKSRQPFQVGAELYGHAGLDADIEIQQLMLDTLGSVGVKQLRLDIGHPQIFRALAEEANLDTTTRSAVFAAVTQKDMPTLNDIAANCAAANKTAMMALTMLPTLYGAATGADNIIDRAVSQLPKTPIITNALDQLRRVTDHFAAQGVPVSVDLGELGGFNYESGIAFAAYAEGAREAVARGGRYDDIGKVFGRARPATGFTMDLKSLLALLPDGDVAMDHILAPANGALDQTAREVIRQLRAQGEVIIARLEGASHGCQRELKQINGQWQVVSLTGQTAN